MVVESIARSPGDGQGLSDDPVSVSGDPVLEPKAPGILPADRGDQRLPDASPKTTGQGRALSDTLLARALEYAQRDWPVCPCVPRDKRPLTPRGFHDATTDPGAIRAWWARWPDANIGIATGKRAAFWVLDADDADALADLIAESGPLPDTALSLTGGGGRQFLFVYPKDGRKITTGSGDLPRGLHVRGEGGYVVAPPSIHPTGREYTWELSSNPLDGMPIASAPGWLLDLVCQTDKPKAPPRDPKTIDLLKEMEAARKALLHLSPSRCNNYEPWVRVGMALSELGAVGLELWDSWSKRSPKYQPGGCAEKWETFEPGHGLTLASLVHWAKEDRADESAAPDARSERLPPTFAPRSVGKIRAEGVPARADVVANVLPRGGLVQILAPPKGLKTWLCLNLALAAVRGERFLATWAMPKTRVLYLSGEGGPALLMERLQLMIPGDAPELANLFLWTPEPGEPRLALTSPWAVDAIANFAMVQRIGLVIVDPLVAFHLSDENSTTDMALLVGSLLDLARRTNAGVALAHHTGKSPQRAGSPAQGRGSTVLWGAVDSSLVLDPCTNGARLTAQLRWGPPPEPMMIHLDPQTGSFTVTKAPTRKALDPEQVAEVLLDGPADLEQIGQALKVQGLPGSRHTVEVALGRLGERVTHDVGPRGRYLYRLAEEEGTLAPF